MPLSDYVLYQLARRSTSPIAHRDQKIGTPSDPGYDLRYSQHQYDRMCRGGLEVPFRDKEVIELGCGHGGISVWLAVNGARRVVGIDLDPVRLEAARHFATMTSERLGCSLPVEFVETSAMNAAFPEASFDMVLADNVFEHFMEPEAVMREAFRLLRPGGMLVVPLFSSLISKWGLHVKRGLRLPWANLVFSERTIIRALRRMAADDARVYDWYPGLRGSPERVRDLRTHGDLNDITYAGFRQMATEIGFRVADFYVFATPLGKILRKAGLRRTRLVEILSSGASARLVKP